MFFQVDFGGRYLDEYIFGICWGQGVKVSFRVCLDKESGRVDMEGIVQFGYRLNLSVSCVQGIESMIRLELGYRLEGGSGVICFGRFFRGGGNIWMVFGRSYGELWRVQQRGRDTVRVICLEGVFGISVEKVWGRLGWGRGVVLQCLGKRLCGFRFYQEDGGLCGILGCFQFGCFLILDYCEVQIKGVE